MLNGVSDNCGTCGFNELNNGKWGHPVEVKPGRRLTAYCTLRKLKIEDPFYTFCRNWHSKSLEVDGPMMSAGFQNSGYERVPWRGNNRPVSGKSGICEVCGESFTDGLKLTIENGEILYFCSTDHYNHWY